MKVYVCSYGADYEGLYSPSCIFDTEEAAKAWVAETERRRRIPYRERGEEFEVWGDYSGYYELELNKENYDLS